MLAILSDIHSNLHALDAVLAVCKRRGVTRFACLGDIVGYGAFPAACVDRIRSLGCPVVQGNHDAYVASGKLDSDISPLARAGVEYSIAHLSPEDRRWLAALPIQLRLSQAVTLVHSSLHEPEEWHYVRISRLAEDSFEHQETPVCFFGHTHVSQIFLRRPNERPESLNRANIHFDRGECYLVNPGSVGQPRNGDAQAQFGLFDEEAMTLEFAHVPYDVEAAVKAIQQAGLPSQLGERLREGY